MKAKRIHACGIPKGDALEYAIVITKHLGQQGLSTKEIENILCDIAEEPNDFLDHKEFGTLAKVLVEDTTSFIPRKKPAPYQQWGKNLEATAVKQLQSACELPSAIAGALMPDAHTGYGLPIGGVLATENTVIPYAVGVDIACRMKMTILDMPVSYISGKKDKLKNVIEEETRFGMGASFGNTRRQHKVLDMDWSVSPVSSKNKDKAWAQLGSSGGGNHFVEFGSFTLYEEIDGVPPGDYMALLSHSGSRGVGASIANHYSKLAMTLHTDLPKHLKHLAWLDLDSAEGQEYWAAMQLMGKYAEANHACIHKAITKSLKTKVLLDIENHHNFAWKEQHFGKECIVHRKGATPAGKGILGLIPGSMATPGFLVRGLGNDIAMNSASHGAGRVMSRTQAKNSVSWHQARRFLKEQNVDLISGGLDEVPMAYKDIHEVMDAQKDLVEILGQFNPRIVKMADD
ncbi:MAG: RtcB family protein [Lentisphaeria bacterium]|nr:RtcB family protein [Lentisphaeria bacterium]